MKEPVTPKRDLVFKKIFGEKGHEKITKDFLEAILDIEIEDLTLDLSTNLYPEQLKGKECQVDVRVRLKDGTQVNVEMQTDQSDYSDKRCLNYWARLYARQIKSGDDYHLLQKTICIWIINGTLMPEFQDFQSDWKIIDEKHGITARFNDLEFHIIELKKFREDDTITPSKKNFWLWFIDYTNREMVNMACRSEKEIKAAKEVYDRLTADKELMDYFDRVDMAESTRKMRETNIRDEGRVEGILETAKRMLEENMDVALIEKVTGLTKDEIEALKNA